MSDQTRYEKVQRKSFEDTESCTDTSTLNDDDEGFNDTNSSRSTKILKHLQCHRRLLIIGVGALVIICAGVFLISLRVMGIIGTKKQGIMNLLDIENDPSIHLSNPPQPDGTISNLTTFCGSTPRIAKSRGCVFDVMSFAWLPTPCLDTEMMERYIAQRTWEWYEDYSMTKKLDLEVVRKGEYKWAFSTQSFHIAHCLYTWEKQGRFLFAERREDEKWVDQGSFGKHHTMHCVDFILKRNLEPNKVSTIWNGVAECSVADEMGTL